jgi:NADPH2:quinone reductase
MKAAVYYETGAPEVLKYEDVAEPTLFADGLLIDVAAIAIQGGDTLNRLGGALASKPHIVGYQASGTVREVGANTKGFATGQAVVATMGFGSHAEVICP